MQHHHMPSGAAERASTSDSHRAQHPMHAIPSKERDPCDTPYLCCLATWHRAVATGPTPAAADARGIALTARRPATANANTRACAWMLHKVWSAPACGYHERSQSEGSQLRRLCSSSKYVRRKITLLSGRASIHAFRPSGIALIPAPMHLTVKT